MERLLAIAGRMAMAGTHDRYCALAQTRLG